MEFIISGKNMDLTEALKDYVQEKLGKVESVLNAEATATVTLSTEKEMQNLEVSVSAGPDTYRAETSEQDMYAAIDKSVDVLLGQIRKTKAKKGKMFKADTIRGKEYDIGDEREKVKDEVVKYIAYSMKPISVEDAKILLKDSTDIFFTFVNIDTDKVNVLYKTNDGNYGIVEPEA